MQRVLPFALHCYFNLGSAMRDWHALAPSAAIHLPMTLCGGQCFRWRRTPRGTWVGVVRHTAYELCDPLKMSIAKPEQKKARKTASFLSPLSLAATAAPPFISSADVSATGQPSADLLWFRCLNCDLRSESDAREQTLFLRHYLALDVDLQKMWLRWTADNPMKSHPLVKCLTPCGSTDLPVSIRHLRQDLHETLLGFLCSQNNNVPRITSLMERLSISYGDYLCDYNVVTGDVRHAAHCGNVKGKPSEQNDGGGWIALHALPSMDQLAAATEESLRALGFGYRSRYLTECAAIISKSGATRVQKEVKDKKMKKKEVGKPAGPLAAVQPYKWYEELASNRLTLQERREKLLALPGVGRKVADCILLFALGHHELVPVDTHMAQVAAEYLACPPAVVVAAKKQRESEASERFKRRRGSNHEELANAVDSGDSVLSSLSWENTLVEWYRNGRGKKAKFPALLLKHHDAIQYGFKLLFGDYCGWAHSILFYARMRSSGNKEATA
ncbi:8-oxoguanine DNA glycosylase [Trypanosoma brucei equiperdum]|uniref:DNA-(apurinic or apyrimidinic site) lyase n=1 Tax=Trypanosoma brucei equiperdum TaxID=630700 RepID=A0A3L6L7U8_9TRYP|nr:8-oxoguanine DNA glycosylase [Trypanosoma brucei equiperdum]